MKTLITLLASLTLFPLFAASDTLEEITTICKRYNKKAIERENKGGTLADLKIFSATQRRLPTKVDQYGIRRDSFERIEETGPYEQDCKTLKKWEKKGLVKCAMKTWEDEQKFRRQVPIYVPIKK